ncbi:hypothetical protein UA75_18625 [Actinoalloteichus sp. GBA129-24]|uniref:Uncharacterized protein n=1 Tax=Actinoalloteichus fjordicus TaxID=1612552 RepID=A0AAC9LG08_9PSEU|nr:hypothetical protein UA74_18135 [Actinoalloteichus fjordicus]APU21715.1 hypothetical protein UA75_18625 [Actinoalloteichus sp. GBA129-24]
MARAVTRQPNRERRGGRSDQSRVQRACQAGQAGAADGRGHVAGRSARRRCARDPAWQRAFRTQPAGVRPPARKEQGRACHSRARHSAGRKPGARPRPRRGPGAAEKVATSARAVSDDQPRQASVIRTTPLAGTVALRLAPLSQVTEPFAPLRRYLYCTTVPAGSETSPVQVG